MAWTEQCKYAFCSNTKALLHKNDGKGLIKILRDLSKESGIPAKTLERWWYDLKSSVPKNEDNPQPIDKSSGKQTGPLVTSAEVPLCSSCLKKPCPVSHKRKDGTIVYRDKCPGCRANTTPGRMRRGKLKTLCPHCGKEFPLTRNNIMEADNDTKSQT